MFSWQRSVDHHLTIILTDISWKGLVKCKGSAPPSKFWKLGKHAKILRPSICIALCLSSYPSKLAKFWKWKWGKSLKITSVRRLLVHFRQLCQRQSFILILCYFHTWTLLWILISVLFAEPFWKQKFKEQWHCGVLYSISKIKSF